MGKHLVAIAYSTKLNELTSSTVDETTLAILKSQGSQGITIVRSQWTIISHN